MFVEPSSPKPCLDNSKDGKYLVLPPDSKFLNPIQIAINYSIEVLPSALQLHVSIELPY